MINFVDLAHEACSAGDSVWISLISASAGVIAGTVAGWFGYRGSIRTAKSSLEAAERSAQSQLEATRLQLDSEARKLQAAHVTTERLRWLQEIRGRLSKLYADLDMQVSLARRPRASSVSEHAAWQARMDEMSARAMDQAHMIHLMLNPAKVEQQALRVSVAKAQAFVMSLGSAEDAEKGDMTRYQSIKQASFDAMTRIGVVAWEKIQKLE